MVNDILDNVKKLQSFVFVLIKFLNLLICQSFELSCLLSEEILVSKQVVRNLEILKLYLSFARIFFLSEMQHNELLNLIASLQFLQAFTRRLPL